MAFTFLVTAFYFPPLTFSQQEAALFAVFARGFVPEGEIAVGPAGAAVKDFSFPGNSLNHLSFLALGTVQAQGDGDEQVRLHPVALAAPVGVEHVGELELELVAVVGLEARSVQVAALEVDGAPEEP